MALCGAHLVVVAPPAANSGESGAAASTSCRNSSRNLPLKLLDVGILCGLTCVVDQMADASRGKHPGKISCAATLCYDRIWPH